MTRYLAFDDITGLLRNKQLVYAAEIFFCIGRKLTLREFAIILRAMERGFSVARIIDMLCASNTGLKPGRSM